MSDRKTRANRANAQASTGPKSAPGRARAARNALRHGLSLPVCSNPVFSEEVEELARKIAGAGANAKRQELARRVAEAEVDLRRMRYTRHQLLSRELSDPYCDSTPTLPKKLANLSKIPRRNASALSTAVLLKDVTLILGGTEKFAFILSQEAKQLLAMDRYERRALLRRNIAIRAFDERSPWAISCNDINTQP
jgi:hypothetical protein